MSSHGISASQLHLEEHFHRAKWNFPQGVSFLNWISGLRPYLSQKTLREELKAVIADLVEQGAVTLRGTTPLTERESKLVRRALAVHLGLAPAQFDGVRDEIRVLQRKIVLELAHAKLMEREAADAEGAAERDVETARATSSPGRSPGRSRVTFEGGRRKPARNQVAPSGGVVGDPNTPGAQHGNADNLRQMLMDLQVRLRCLPVRNTAYLCTYLRTYVLTYVLTYSLTYLWTCRASGSPRRRSPRSSHWLRSAPRSSSIGVGRIRPSMTTTSR